MSERREITLTGSGFACCLLAAFLAGVGAVLMLVVGTPWGLLPWLASLPLISLTLAAANTPVSRIVT